MADKQPVKKGRGRPPKPKNINVSRADIETSGSSEASEASEASKVYESTKPEANIIKSNSEYIDNINNYKIDNPDDIQSIIQNINDSEIAMAMDESFASNIAMQMNASRIISNNYAVEVEDETQLSIILEKFREKEEQEKRDEEFARSLAEENNNSEDNDDIGASGFSSVNNNDDLSDILEQIRQMELNSNSKSKNKSKSNIKLHDKFMEERNIRNMQDIEYEQSLFEDKKKDEIKRNFEIDKKDKISEIEEESEEESEDMSNDKVQNNISNINIIKTENKILSVKEMRDVRLAFFNKK